MVNSSSSGAESVVKTLKVIFIVFLVGFLPLGFIAHLLIFSSLQIPDRVPVMLALTFVNVVMALMSIVIPLVFSKLQGNLRSASTVQVRLIVKISVAGASAIFGVMTLVEGLKYGAISLQPLFWLNLLTPILFLVFALFSFPTQGSISQQINSQ